MKRTRSFLAASIAILCCPILPATANPLDGTVTAGGAAITGGPGTLTIQQTTQRAIIQWRDFSIGAGEMTRFVQPNAGAAVLNRVTGGIPSNIQGTLQANGQVFLVNPNGIVVGPNGRVNTAAFTASTLDVPDAQFMAGGDLRFSGDSAKGVVNLGTITASEGDVVLLGRTVENAGSISAPKGTAALAAGSDILLKAAGDERVVVNSGITTGGKGVDNRGRIAAARAELKAAGGNVYALAVNNSGVVHATGLSQQGGRVILGTSGTSGGVVRNSGRLIAKNANGSGGRVKISSGKTGRTENTGTIDVAAASAAQNGGTAEVLGGHITLGMGSLIDAGGANGGISIGVSADVAAQTGTRGGIATLARNPAAEAAENVTIESGSRILANSTDAGNGGRIVVWSEEKTSVDGVIEAKGGALGGNGGFIETSARKNLVVAPALQLGASAPKGMGGSWLLDPEYNITIVAGGAGATTDNSGAPNFTPTNDNSDIGADLITAQLNAGTSVIISTNNGAGPGAGQAGRIRVASEILKTTGGLATLTLDAAGDIDIQANVGSTTPSLLNLELNAGSGGANIGVNLASSATITVGDLTIFSYNGGSVTLSGTVTANTLSAEIPVVFPGPTFNGAMFINNAANQIGTINALTAQEGIVLRDSAGGLIINGFVTPTQHNGSGLPGGISQFNAILRTVGDFTINPGGTIFANSNGDIFIEAQGGYFINNSGSPFNQGLGGGSGWAIYSASDATTAQGGRFNDGGLYAAQAPVVNGVNPIYNTSIFPAGLSAAGTPGTDITTKTFYFATTGTGVPAGGSSGGGGGGSGGSSSGGATTTTVGGFARVSRITNSLDTQLNPDLYKVIAKPAVVEISKPEAPSAPLAPVTPPRRRSVLYVGDLAGSNLEPKVVDAAVVKEWGNAHDLLVRLGVWNSPEGKGVKDIINDIDASRRALAAYTKRASDVEAGRLSLDEYNRGIQDGLKRLDILRKDLAAAEEKLLAPRSVPYLTGDSKALVFVDNTTLKVIFAVPTTAEIVANIVAGGGMNLVGQDGSSLVGQDASSLVGQDGSSIVAGGGMNLIGKNGASLVGDGGASLVGDGGASILATNTTNFLATNTTNFLATNTTNFLATNTTNFLATNTTNFLATNTTNVIGQSGSAVIGQSGSAVIGQSGSAVIGQSDRGSALIGKGGAGVIGPIKQ